MPTLYDILEVSPEASPEVIRVAYRSLAAKYHPDRGASGELFKLIADAYETLSDPKKRADYDAMMAASEHRASTGKKPPLRPSSHGDAAETRQSRPATGSTPGNVAAQTSRSPLYTKYYWIKVGVLTGFLAVMGGAEALVATMLPRDKMAGSASLVWVGAGLLVGIAVVIHGMMNDETGSEIGKAFGGSLLLAIPGFFFSRISNALAVACSSLLPNEVPALSMIAVHLLLGFVAAVLLLYFVR